VWVWCNKRLKLKTDGSTRLTYTGMCGELEHRKIEARLIGESFGCVMGECGDLEAVGVSSIFKTTRSAAALVRMLPTLDLSCEENVTRRKWKLVGGN
jgi:hypothetical protein